MKDKNFGISVLNQLYGKLLTEKQEEMLKAYYDFDCSLKEIADEYGISRQAVRDNIKRAEISLYEFESKFGLLAVKTKVSSKFEELKRILKDKQLLDDEIKSILIETERALEGE